MISQSNHQPPAKKKRGRPRKNPDLTEEERYEAKLEQNRAYSRTTEAKKKRKARDGQRNSMRNNVSGSLVVNNFNHVTGPIKTVLKKVRGGPLGKRHSLPARLTIANSTIPEAKEIEDGEIEDEDEDVEDEASLFSNASTQRLLSGKPYHDDEAELHVTFDDDNVSLSNVSAVSDSTAVSNGTATSNNTYYTTYTAASSDDSVISLRDVYTREQLAAIYKTLEYGDTGWTIHIQQRMFERSIFESAIFKALQVGVLQRGDSGNFKIVHNDLVVIIGLKPNRGGPAGTCNLVTTYRRGRKNLDENFARKPNNADDIKRYEQCRAIFIKQYKKFEKFYDRHNQNKDDIEEEREYQQHRKRSIDHYDDKIESRAKRNKRST